MVQFHRSRVPFFDLVTFYSLFAKQFHKENNFSDGLFFLRKVDLTSEYSINSQSMIGCEVYFPPQTLKVKKNHFVILCIYFMIDEGTFNFHQLSQLISTGGQIQLKFSLSLNF